MSVTRFYADPRVILIGVEPADLAPLARDFPDLRMEVAHERSTNALSVERSSSSPRSVATIFCFIGEPAASAELEALTASAGLFDLVIVEDAVRNRRPELASGLARVYTYSTEHPVESGAYWRDGKIRFVGRVDPWEGSYPDSSIEPGPELGRWDRSDRLLAVALAAVEGGAGLEQVARQLRRSESERVNP